MGTTAIRTASFWPRRPIALLRSISSTVTLTQYSPISSAVAFAWASSNASVVPGTIGTDFGTLTLSKPVSKNFLERDKWMFPYGIPIHLDGEIWARPHDDVRQVDVEILPGALNVIR